MCRNSHRPRWPCIDSVKRNELAPAQAGFVRVNMLYHSLNRGVHIVEVTVEESL